LPDSSTIKQGEIMTGENPPENVRNSNGVGDAFNCGIDEKLLHRYIYGSVTAAEEREVQSHLANCKLCLDEVIAITKVLQQPPSEEEKAAFRKVATLNPEARLEKVMAKVEELYPPVTEEYDDNEKAPEIYVWERVKLWWEAREPVPPYAYAAAALLVLAIGSFFGIRYYQNTYPIIQAQGELRAHYQTYVNLQNFAESAPRLSGGYAHAAIMVMGEDSASYLENAHQRLETVLEKDAKSIKAKHVLAQIFMMQGAYTQADSVLRQIPVSLARRQPVKRSGSALFAHG
jgi:cytochrome c-type biogenesis protein CcmH/NrfG